jgi:hypothetical protein
MSDTVVRFREAWAPHRALATTRVEDLDYGFMVGRPTTATFRVSRSDPNVGKFPDAFKLGQMVTIERTDNVLPWAGYITQRTLPLGDPYVSFTCKDHAGALFAKARTAKDWQPLDRAAGDLLKLVFSDVDARAEPPLMVRLGGDLAGGPNVEYTAKAQTFLAFLQTVSRITGWEWGLHHSIEQEPVTTLLWRDQIGGDYRNEIVFDQEIGFTEARLTQSSDGYLGGVMVVGGSGTFRDRPAAQANREGRADAGVDGHKVVADEAAESPALAGTQVLIEQAVTSVAALGTAAVRRFKSIELLKERLTIQLREGGINMKRLELGSVYTVRFSDLDFGLGVERAIRAIGIRLGQDGVVQIVAEVLRG